MSTQRIDHAQEARDWILAAERADLSMEETTAFASIAQAHATLAVAEQQRMSNRIALGMYTNADGSRAAQFAVTRITGMSSVEVHPEIREALGLA